MLEKLTIKNYLIIKDIDINFSRGINILTGETGAGKTIIMDALTLILGERSDYSLIHKNSDKLIIEGIFDFSGNKTVNEFLISHNLVNDEYLKANMLIIRREILKRGISRNFINDNPVILSDLKEFGDLIVDIHSQNEHQYLLKKEMHLEVLDNYSNNENILDNYKKLYVAYAELINKYFELIEKKKLINERKEYIKFQLKEINTINPSENEYEELEKELKILENSEQINQHANSCLQIISNSENNIISYLSNLLRELKKISSIDESINSLTERIENIYIEIKDINETLNNYSENIHYDYEKTEQIRDRLSKINFLKKKYSLSVKEIVTKAEDLSKELEFIENYDVEIENLKKEISKQKEILFDESVKLSAMRKKKSKELEKEINKLFKEVGLESAELQIKFSEIEKEKNEFFIFIKENRKNVLTQNGIDNVEFLVRTNKGLEFTPLRKTASGGEISRIMLVIKTCLADKDKTPVLLFDEIDAGISGAIANKVGKLLKSLSKTHQIILITHLPQIAATGDTNFHISKIEEKNETTASIKMLDESEKVIEIAKLLSGEKVTDSSKKVAKELVLSYK